MGINRLWQQEDRLQIVMGVDNKPPSAFGTDWGSNDESRGSSGGGGCGGGMTKSMM